MTKADKERKIKNINLIINDACAEIRDFSNNLKVTEEESQRLKILRQIEDKIKDIRKFYKDIEKIQGETEKEEIKKEDTSIGAGFNTKFKFNNF